MRPSETALVIGGGVAGMQASLDLADQGFQVVLVEKTPSIGGVMAMLDKTFPTLDCSACILTPRLSEVSRHPNIKLLTYSEVTGITGEAGDFKVKVLKKARRVLEDKCSGCGDCVPHCPI
ncbi:MAG: FAD-dependent oxidoreductase, partial [Candidatus Thorarchaeota archaeon]